MVHTAISIDNQLVEMSMMVSGHYDDYVSEHASKNLIKEVDVQVSDLIAKNPNILGDAIPICLVETIQKFDATLHSAMIAKMREMDSKPWSEWTKEDIPRFLGMKEKGEFDHEACLCRIDCVDWCDH